MSAAADEPVARAKDRSAGQVVWALLSAIVATAAVACVLAAPADAWAPGNDGMIAFATAPTGGNFFTGTLPRAGSIQFMNYPTGTLAPGLIGSAWEPAWSPDGAKIAYVSYVRSGLGWASNGIGLANADGSGQHIVVTESGVESPAFSPDGNFLAFIAPDPFGGYVIDVLEISTGVTHIAALLESETPDRIAWSPDGSYIGFTAGPASLFSGTTGVFAAPVAGGSVRQLVSDGSLELGDLDWDTIGLNFYLESGAMGVISSPDPSAPVPAAGAPSFPIPFPMGDFALAPREPAAGLASDLVGVATSNNGLEVALLSSRSVVAAEYPPCCGGTPIQGVAWQPQPTGPPARFSFIVRGDSARLSRLSRSLLAVLGCPSGPRCHLHLTASSSGRSDSGAQTGDKLLGEATASIGGGKVRNVTIHFNKAGRRSLSAGRVMAIDLRVTSPRGKTLAHENGLSVRMPSTLSVSCPEAASIGAAAAISGRLSVTKPGGRSVLVDAWNGLGGEESLTTGTAADGSFATKVPIDQGGDWTLTVIWTGSRSTSPATARCELPVQP